MATVTITVTDERAACWSDDVAVTSAPPAGRPLVQNGVRAHVVGERASKPKKLTIGSGMNRRLTKAGEAAELRFDALVNAYLATVGAPIPVAGVTSGGVRFGYEWTVETKAGPYKCAARGHYIVGMFEDVDRAKASGLAAFNGYSGKWNHHFDVGAGEREVEFFRQRLNAILPEKGHLLSAETSARVTCQHASRCAASAVACEYMRWKPCGTVAGGIAFYYFCAEHWYAPGPYGDSPASRTGIEVPAAK
jgi:hypothetical protein